MYRSASTNRVADDHSSFHPSSSSSSKLSTTLRALSLEAKELPVYESLSEAAKKERSRDKIAQNAVHLIPLVLLLCAFVLWFLSSPDTDMPMKDGIVSARIEGLTIEGDGDSDGTQQGNLPIHLQDFASTRKDHVDHRKFLATKGT